MEMPRLRRLIADRFSCTVLLSLLVPGLMPAALAADKVVTYTHRESPGQSGTAAGGAVGRGAVGTEGGSRYGLARQYFTHGQYRAAAESLRLMIYSGSHSPAVWLLLGQSYQAMKENTAARQTYLCVQKYFPGTAEAHQAAQAMSALPVVSGGASASGLPSSPLHTGGSEGAKRLYDRVVVVEPKFGHPAVAASTYSTVMNIIYKLPEPVYNILDQGGVRVFVTPNLIDRFPDSVTYKLPDTGAYIIMETGRTYDRDVYVCERLGASPGAGSSLLPANSRDEIVTATYLNLAHALDSCLEFPSHNEQFIRLYQSDLASADKNSPDNIKIYLLGDNHAASRTFAGLASSIMGNNSYLTRWLDRNFPRCRAWIQARIEVLVRGGHK